MRLGSPVYHSGAWGMATLEVGLAIRESTRTHKEIELTHQIAMPDSYDAEYPVTVEEEVKISG